MPIVNPDGVVENHRAYPNGGGMHRKNMRGSTTSCVGVDLNRNYACASTALRWDPRVELREVDVEAPHTS